MTFLIFLLVLSPAHAATFKEKCPDIPTCANAVAALTGDKYVFDGDVKGTMQATDNVMLDPSNADLLFTNALNANGFARVPLAEPRTFQIMRLRDARDSALPLIDASKTQSPRLPKTWDLVTMRYKATAGGEIVEHLARTSRSFMPANSRMIPDEASGTLIVTDSAANLMKLYTIIQGMDVAPSAELKKKWKEEREHRRNAPPPPGGQGPGGPPPEKH